MAAQAVFSVCTLYMMMIMLRWLGPWVELNTNTARLSWIGRMTDPLIKWVRSLLPNLGPVDFGPVAALLLVWLVRSVLVAMAMRIRTGPV